MRIDTMIFLLLLSRLLFPLLFLPVIVSTVSVLNVTNFSHIVIIFSVLNTVMNAIKRLASLNQPPDFDKFACRENGGVLCAFFWRGVNHLYHGKLNRPRSPDFSGINIHKSRHRAD